MSKDNLKHITFLRLGLATGIITPTMHSTIFNKNSTCMITYIARANLLKEFVWRSALSTIVLAPAFDSTIRVQATCKRAPSRDLTVQTNE